MDALLYLFWLSKMAWSCVTAFWFVSIPLFLLCLYASVYRIRHEDPSKKKSLWSLGTLYACPLLLLAIGTILRQSRIQWWTPLICAVLLALLVLGAYLIVRLRGLRFAATSHLLVAGWLTICSGLVASMSISDSWL